MKLFKKAPIIEYVNGRYVCYMHCEYSYSVNNIIGAHDDYHVYPRYTMSANRYSHFSPYTELYIETMIPVERFFKLYYVHFITSSKFEVFDDNVFQKAISNFHKEVEYNQKNLNPKKLIGKEIPFKP